MGRCYHHFGVLVLLPFACPRKRCVCVARASVATLVSSLLSLSARCCSAWMTLECCSCSSCFASMSSQLHDYFVSIYCDGERSRTKTAMSETQTIKHSHSLHYFSCVHLHFESTAVIANRSPLPRIADRSPLLQWRHVQSLIRLIPSCSPDSKNG